MIDLGILTACSVIIVMLVKQMVFGLSWITTAMMVLAIAYVVVFAIRKRIKPQQLKQISVGYLLVSFFMLVSIFVFDEHQQHQGKVFEGALIDSIEEDEFVVEDHIIETGIQEVDTLDIDSVQNITAVETAVTDTVAVENVE